MMPCFYDPRWKPKTKVAVELRTFDGEVLRGSIFVGPDMRVQDVLNSQRPFLPFEREDGEIELINKESIARLKPSDKGLFSHTKPAGIRGKASLRLAE